MPTKRTPRARPRGAALARVADVLAAVPERVAVLRCVRDAAGATVVGLEVVAATPAAEALLAARPRALAEGPAFEAMLAAVAAGEVWEGTDDGLAMRAVPAGDLVTVTIRPRQGTRRTTSAEAAGERELAHVLAERAARLTGGDRALVVRISGPGVAELGRWAAGTPAQLPPTAELTARVRDAGGPVRVALPGSGAAVAAPMGAAASPWGLLVVAAAAGAALDVDATQAVADIADLGAAALAGLQQREDAEHDRAVLAGLRSAVQDGLLVTDARGVIVEASDRFLDMVRLERDEVVGATPPYPFWPDGPAAAGRGLGRVPAGREVVAELRRGDGSSFVAMVQTAPLRAGGRAGGHVATVRDLSIRRALERALRDREAEEAALLRVAALVASGGDADELAALVAEEATRLLDGDVGHVVRFSPSGTAGVIATWGIDPGPGGPDLVALAERARDADMPAAEPAAPPPVAVAAPVTVFHEPWGAIAVGTTGPRPLSPEAPARLANFARLAEIAVAKVESRQRMSELVESGIAIASGLDLETVLQRLLETARRVLGARYAALGVLSGDGTRLGRFLWSGLDDEAAARIGEPPQGRGLLGRLITAPRPLRVARIAEDAHSSGFPPGHPPMTSFLGVPISLGDEVFGNLYVTDKVSGPFTDDDERLAETLAAQAAVAVANARTFTAERERLLASAAVQAARVRERAAADGLRRAIEAQEAERARVARELHDEAGQVLTAIALHLRALEGHVEAGAGRERLGELRRAVNAASSGLRDLATRLRPSGLHEHGLASALERQADRLRESSGIDVDVSLVDLPGDLPDEVQITLFRVVQEALTNVARHSGATAVSLLARTKAGRLRIMVEDNGRGFDPETPTHRLGLVGIRERVALLGGELQIESAPGQGCTVVVEIGAGGRGGRVPVARA